MDRPLGSRVLIAVCGALAILLAALGVVQYRWSTRVAAADVQRETEHLNTAAALFASDFNRQASSVTQFLQNDAWSAYQSHQPLTRLPKLISDLYFLEIPGPGERHAQHLSASGQFTPGDLPEWAAIPSCLSLVIEQPPAIVAPVLSLTVLDSPRPGMHLIERLGPQNGRCFIARLNEAYLKQALIPQLIKQSFGAAAMQDYDFAVVSLNSQHIPIFGSIGRADLRHPFFSVELPGVGLVRARSPAPPPGNAVFVQRFESKMVAGGPHQLANLFGSGIWELQIARKGMPLAAAFERGRRRDVLISIAVEALLLAAIVFLVVAARRTQQLADRKMQFVAGVSHELRTPVSAIAMLSRNQADGLVSGPERVQQYGELIHQQSRRLNEMVEQTLQFAGMHSNLRRPALQNLDLRVLIEEALDARREQLMQAGFEIELALAPNLPQISGDAQWLRSAIDNLLSNAEKYGESGRWIRIGATYSESAREVSISVEDRGAGIEPGDREEIFQPFARGRAATAAQIPGSGLGLSLVRSAVQAHRGSVTLISQPGRGSTFTLHLPA
ncbi:MAG TPA: HAMP domain-containing sensor histidine kinase [Bryobacteraceae bacterium]|nr:HAMP domain-containing sensor histidine kinase [Bryobacteraceae bacterium]